MSYTDQRSRLSLNISGAPQLDKRNSFRPLFYLETLQACFCRNDLGELLVTSVRCIKTKGDTHVKGLLDLKNLPHFAEPVSAQSLRPALETVHLTGSGVQVALLQESLGARQDALDVIATDQTLLLEHDLAEKVAGSVAGNAGLLGEQRGLANLVGDYPESVNELCGVGKTTLVGGGVDGGDGGVDDGVLGSNLLEGDEFAGEGLGVRGVLEAGTNSIDSDVQLLGAEVGVDDLVPAGGELLEVGDGSGQLVKLAETALTLGFDVVLDLGHELLLQSKRLLQQLVVETLLVKLLLALQQKLDALVVALLNLLHLVLELLSPLRLLDNHGRLDAGNEVVGGLVEVGNLGLDLGSGLLLDRGLDGLDLASNLAQLALGLVDGGRVAAVGLVSVDDGDDVVEHVDEILDDGLRRVLDLQGVDRGNGRESRRLIDLGGLESSRVLLGRRRLGLLDRFRRGLGRLWRRLGLLDRLVLLLLDGDDLGSGLVDSARLATSGLSVVSDSPRRTALGGDLDLAAGVSSLELVRDVGEPLAEVGLLEVEDGLLAKGNILGEEVVEVVIDTRVPDTAAETNGAEDGEGQDEVSQPAEEALLLRGGICGRLRRRCGSLCLGNGGVRGRGGERNVLLRDRRLDGLDLGDGALLRGDGLCGRQGSWSRRVRLLVVGKVSPAGGSDLPLAANNSRRRPVPEHPHGSNRRSQHEGMRWADKA
ncbi:hypothetical protein ColLi_07753 [Colletotrichum liriopes]|uniref:Uncharacterized protein n=1 Tax=Colletotrichum liriopes TaxID=708192 RepID=A0AA37GQG1_9PEZI|nr:hypothetical protein ColLi_07753 [Colletotrichum liriopes]